MMCLLLFQKNDIFDADIPKKYQLSHMSETADQQLIEELLGSELLDEYHELRKRETEIFRHIKHKAKGIMTLQEFKRKLWKYKIHGNNLTEIEIAHANKLEKLRQKRHAECQQTRAMITQSMEKPAQKKLSPYAQPYVSRYAIQDDSATMTYSRTNSASSSSSSFASSSAEISQNDTSVLSGCWLNSHTFARFFELCPVVKTARFHVGEIVYVADFDENLIGINIWEITYGGFDISASCCFGYRNENQDEKILFHNDEIAVKPSHKHASDEPQQSYDYWDGFTCIYTSPQRPISGSYVFFDAGNGMRLQMFVQPKLDVAKTLSRIYPQK